MTVTEIVSVALKPGSDIGDSASPAAAVLKDTLSTILQQDGARKIYFGAQVEDASVLHLFIEWDTVEHHKTFIASSTYPSFQQRFGSVVASAPVIFHADLEPSGSVPKVFAAPVTEFVTAIATDDESSAAKQEALQKFRQAAIEAQPEGFHDAAGGRTVEEVEVDGVKGPGLVLVIGWTSVDAHLKFRETEAFKNNIGLLREGVAKLSVKHAALLNFVP